ncbi:MAG: hypothetical protein QG620_427 [Patescibacteria group bacterium]|nr:hypothetical protein [Patescibacteria group bacterium]
MMMNIKQVALLNKEGEIIESFGKGKKKYQSSSVLPVVIDYYLWDSEKQHDSAEKYKDQIKRVFYQEKVEPKIKNMLQDDIQRLELAQKFSYGEKVLETGCSDGSVSIKIAQLPKVKRVVGIDIRPSAIKDGKLLIKDLVRKKEISSETAKKVFLLNYANENFPSRYGQFDSVCAYEIFEHLSPQDLLPIFQSTYKFLKKNGNFFVSVPNRFPDKKYDKLGRSRWKWFDHRNFFSQLSLEMFLKKFFKQVKFHSLYPGEKIEDGIYLICECKGKLYD